MSCIVVSYFIEQEVEGVTQRKCAAANFVDAYTILDVPMGGCEMTVPNFCVVEVYSDTSQCDLLVADIEHIDAVVSSDVYSRSTSSAMFVRRGFSQNDADTLQTLPANLLLNSLTTTIQQKS